MKKINSDVLKILQENSRYTNEEIATMLGVDKAAVDASVAEMENQGLILKYTAIINSEKIHKKKVEALIELRVTPQKHTGFDAIAEQIYKFSEVKSLFLMSGAYDLAVMIEGNDLKDIAFFVSEKLSCLDSIVSTATHFILKKYKVEGTMMFGENDIERLAVQL